MINDRYHNPDILTCIANLSSDEVFTPPKISNKLLDTLPNDIWSNENTKFLDPFSKSGVFLREITKRLMNGLEKKIPNKKKRLNHILKKQIFGIGITELTSLISRRTLYCSKNANSEFSIVKFDDQEGNLRYIKTKHDWWQGKCKYCGVSKEMYDRKEDLESYSYSFIHDNNIDKYFEMKFDVIIGNPPYQMSDGGAFASASPIYQKFVEQAIKLNPTYLSMIIPGRWYSGGKGLDTFRNLMLNDNRIKEIHDFPIGEDCFPGIRIAGGVCYFLWEKNYKGSCTVHSYKKNKLISKMKRPLLEKNSSTFIRLNEGISILRKVQDFSEKSFSNIVSPRKPFGLATDFFKNPLKYKFPKIYEDKIVDGLTIYGSFNYKTVKRYVPKNYPITANKDSINKFKVYVSMSLDNGFDWTKERLKPFIGKPGEIVTENFLLVGPFEKKESALNAIDYMETKFFHILLFLKKISQHVTSKVYEFIPMQDFTQNWSDEKLYKKYGLNKKEIEFIESNIKPKD